MKKWISQKRTVFDFQLGRSGQKILNFNSLHNHVRNKIFELLNFHFSNILFGLWIVTVPDEWFANKILCLTWMCKLSFFWSLMDDQMTPTQSELLLKKWKDIILKLISTWDFRIWNLILGLSTSYFCLPRLEGFQDFSLIFRFRQLALEESTSKRSES